MSIRNYLVIGAAAMTLAACSTTVEGLNVRDWVGQKGDDLVQSWGTPHHSYAMADGGKEIGYFFQNHSVSGPKFSTHRITNCMVNFEIDKAGKIIDASTAGTKCQVYPHEQMHPKT